MKKVQADFGEGGTLAQKLPNFEVRDQQLQMAQAVEDALEDDAHLFVEAGTGTGKTLAYLLPALRSRRRVIVSTATKTLQHQLMDKDIPLLQKIAGSVNAVLLKGRQNYLCQTAYERFDAQPNFRSVEEERHWAVVQKWVEKTTTGDRGELEHLPEDFSLWARLTATADQCAGKECSNYDRCFLVQQRERANEADIIVVNHHLFFADCAVRERMDMRLLPEAEALVFDEGHHLEETASAFFTVHVSNRSLASITEDIDQEIVGNGQTTLNIAEPRASTQALEDALHFLEESSDAFWDRVRDSLALADAPGANTRSVLARAPILDAADPETRAELIEVLRYESEEIFAAHKVLNDALSAVQSALKEGAFGDTGTRLRDRLQQYSVDLHGILHAKESDDAIHLVLSRRGMVAMESVPLDVRPIFWRHVFGRRGATVITSATLSTDGNFRFLRARLGAPDDAVELSLPSPFDYLKQSILYVPPTLPEPNSPRFVEEIAPEIEKLVGITQGRAFVLFTSYRNMRQAHALLSRRLPYKIFLQGEMSRARLLEEFRTTKGAVLFATASFWEGVDVPGDALSLVIIDKLPFANPSDPLTSARARHVEQHGGNSFRDYSVPQAIIQLKQGFGRLIRTGTDLGIVAIMDQRLLNKPYGRRFIDSLPRARRTQDIDLVERWWAHVNAR